MGCKGDRRARHHAPCIAHRCEALKSLQTANSPFPDEEAYQVIAEEFEAKGPIAPEIPPTAGCDPEGPTVSGLDQCKWQLRSVHCSSALFTVALFTAAAHSP